MKFIRTILCRCVWSSVSHDTNSLSSQSQSRWLRSRKSELQSSKLLDTLPGSLKLLSSILHCQLPFPPFLIHPNNPKPRLKMNVKSQTHSLVRTEAFYRYESTHPICLSYAFYFDCWDETLWWMGKLYPTQPQPSTDRKLVHFLHQRTSSRTRYNHPHPGKSSYYWFTTALTSVQRGLPLDLQSNPPLSPISGASLFSRTLNRKLATINEVIGVGELLSKTSLLSNLFSFLPLQTCQSPTSAEGL
jgi:hypothetical protein